MFAQPHPATPSRALASAIQSAAIAVELCAYCQRHGGLCWAHFSGVVPLLARPSWVQDIGTVHVEQTERQQTPEELERADAAKLAALREIAQLAKRRRAQHSVQRRINARSREYAVWVASLSNPANVGAGQGSAKVA